MFKVKYFKPKSLKNVPELQMVSSVFYYCKLKKILSVLLHGSAGLVISMGPNSQPTEVRTQL